jgi:hypothetical protein
MCTNKDLIGGLLRSKVGFTGVLATDCGALNDATFNHHRYASNRDTATAAIKAGVDSNCGNVFPTALPDAIGNKTLTEDELDVSVRRLLRARFQLGLFDEGNKAAGVPTFDIDSVNSKAHQALALQAAREGVVLLQNNDVEDESTHAKLPLSKDVYKTVAMVGPNANASMNLLSGYHGDSPFLISPLQAMSAKWGSSNVQYSVGCNMSDKDPAQSSVHITIPAAVAAAKVADVTVLGLGLCGDNYGGGPPHEDPTCFVIDESETIDRQNITLPGSQMDLFRAVLAVGKPLVVFIMNAGAVDVSEIVASGVPIVSAGYGGEYGGQATADVLAGDYNPGGALTYTVYPQSYLSMQSYRDMSLRKSTAAQVAAGKARFSSPGRTYRFLDTALLEPVFSFGHGLSYTSFELVFAKGGTPAQGANILPGQDTEWIVQLTNTGNAKGGVVVVCYTAAVNQTAVKVPPIRSVFDFARVEDLPSLDNRNLNTKLLAFTLTSRGRALVDEAGQIVYPPGQYSVQCEAGGVAKTAAAIFVVGA